MKHNKITMFFKKHVKFLKFIIVGSFNTFLDISIFSVFTSLIGINAIFANIISTSVTMIVSFFLNSKIVFKSERRNLKVMLSFFAITLFNGWIIQSSIIYIVLNSLKGPLICLSEYNWLFNLFAKVCGVSVSLILNFLGYKYIFKNKQ